VNVIQHKIDAVPGDFVNYLREKLSHLGERDRLILEPVLQQYKHLFYGIGSRELGCISQVEHGIETGEARPIKRNPYRIHHALKLVVEEHVDDILERKIIDFYLFTENYCSSSIVLVYKTSKDGSVKYKFCVDYRALTAVTKPDAYPIPNIADTLDSLGQSKTFSVLGMASGYHQIPIKPEHRTFRSHSLSHVMPPLKSLELFCHNDGMEKENPSPTVVDS
jgi:hypothetical protein